MRISLFDIPVTACNHLTPENGLGPHRFQSGGGSGISWLPLPGLFDSLAPDWQEYQVSGVICQCDVIPSMLEHDGAKQWAFKLSWACPPAIGCSRLS